MIQKGKKVSIHYTLQVEGKVVDSSVGQEPLSYVHGEQQILPGLEEGLSGLDVGDKKEIQLPPEKAYGEHNPKAIRKVPRPSFKDSDKIKKGDVLNGKMGEHPFQAWVIDVNDQEVTLDLNHPLAGKSLDFQVEVMAVD